MPLPLDQWQEKLATHFNSLAESREGSGFPIFALEHPLTPMEIEQLSSHLREYISLKMRLGPYGLCWVVYATEIGYGYTGDEYWQSFEEVTPGWMYQHRDALRARFRKFKEEYSGVRPSGAWAANFPIIAWPITHAILPKYLQHQFAYAIYQLRFRLAQFRSLDSISAGRMLASYSYDMSTRFQQFLQQEELTGRILLSLLGISPESGPEPIYEPTLKRIVADLDHVNVTRARLREARTVYDRFKGLGRPDSGYARTNVRDSVETLNNIPYPDLSPKIFLRHADGGKWSVVVEVPSFTPVAALESDLGIFLKRTRCRVAGSQGVKPAGWVLSHSRIAIIKSWPDTNAPLLSFEKNHTLLDRLLRTDCLISSGTLWLFRIGADGIAREIIGRVVRPGFNYIVLSPKLVPEDSSIVSSCVLDCADINAFRLSIPTTVSAEVTKWLSDRGIQVARTVRVWPAGLPCRGWDGEGQTEWLTTEEPCFGIIHDYPVSQYVVNLNGSTEEVLPVRDIGEAIFIRLQALPVGKHKLTIIAKRHDSITDIVEQPYPEGVANLIVREPEPWVPGLPSHAGLIVTLDPHDSDLDEFWENKVDISVLGPDSHTVNCTVSLERSNGDEIFRSSIPGPFVLPLTAETWHSKFESFIQKEEDTNWCYPEAATGRLHISGGELGEYVTSFHRDVSPVRWVTRYSSAGLSIKLIDDTGLPDDALCEFFSMVSPVKSVSIDISDLAKGLSPDQPGALFAANHGEHQDLIVISYGLSGQGLQGLGVKPDFSEVLNNEIPITQAVQALSMWHIARLIGPLAEIRRSQITRELSSSIFERLCGRNWAEAEQKLNDSSQPDAAENALLHRINAISGFGVALMSDYSKFLTDVTQSSDWFLDLARRCHVSKNQEMCQFAVRLSFLPHTLSRFKQSELERFLKGVSSEQQLIRGARFGSLLCERHMPGEYARFVRSQRWQ